MAQINDLLVETFFRTTLTASAAPGATSIQVRDANGFPTPSEPTYFYLTLINEDGDVEVVKIGGVSGNSLTLFTGETVSGTFLSSNSRAEHWFTAEAFRDIQTAIDTITGGVYPGVDNSSIEADATLRIKADGVTRSHMADDSVGNEQIVIEAIGTDELQTNAVTALKILAGAVTNAKIGTGIEADKLDSTGTTKVPLLAIPKINFQQINYTEGDADQGAPSEGNDGDIVIEFEDRIPD